MITNHGCHSPVIELTTDTGGQNFYINDLSNALVRLGYKVTILNRGGYNHPVTNKLQKGIVYYDKIWGKIGQFCRLIYLEDSQKRFITKENLERTNLIQEKEFLVAAAKKISWNLKDIYFISSHYWDAGILGIEINKELEKEGIKATHVWTTHSLGQFKKEMLKDAPRSTLKRLNFAKRLAFEEEIISECDGIIATSNKMRDYLSKYKAKVKNHLWFPPGVNIRHTKPMTISQCKDALKVLQDKLKLKKKEVINLINKRIVFLELSRTAKAKQKDMVLKAFSKMDEKEKVILIMNVDKSTDIYQKLREIYDNFKKKDQVILIDKFLSDKEVAQLFSLANVFITPSLSDPWGMSCQEAAASKSAIISYKNVAFAMQVLKNNALIVNKNYPRLYAEKMDILVREPNLRKRLANNAYKLVANHYSWEALAEQFIKDMKKKRMIQ